MASSAPLNSGGSTMAAEEELVLGIKRQEFQATMEKPAVACNKFYIFIGGLVRIAFAEQMSPDTDAFVRTTVAMSFHDAIALKNALASMLADAEAQMAAATKK